MSPHPPPTSYFEDRLWHFQMCFKVPNANVSNDRVFAPDSESDEQLKDNFDLVCNITSWNSAGLDGCFAARLVLD